MAGKDKRLTPLLRADDVDRRETEQTTGAKFAVFRGDDRKRAAPPRSSAEVVPLLSMGARPRRV